MKKIVAVFTASRADYGLLRPLLRRLKRSRVLSPRLGVGGSHYVKSLGHTYRDILADGFTIDFKIPPPKRDDIRSASEALGRGVIESVRGLSGMGASGLVVLGDRYETFAAVSAAWSLGIPVAHIHGGELTRGSADEGWRHAITKLSHFHFTSTEVYRQRVIRMGEEPQRVFNVGALGVENALAARRRSRRELEKSLGFVFGPRTLLVTIHPPTRDPSLKIESVLAGLEALKETTLLFTGSNADPGGCALWRRLLRFVASRPNAHAWESLGADRYLSLVGAVDAVAGNSSSGIIEAPALGVPSVDIGERQRGRVAGASVIRCRATRGSVRRAAERALSPEFLKTLSKPLHPYGEGCTSDKIATVLERVLFRPVKAKSFYEGPL